jgi:acyl-CoA ligase (AMP-forming) (exosortase A-associated)
MATLAYELILHTALEAPDAEALAYQGKSVRYGELASAIDSIASALIHIGLTANERVAIYLEKRIETVVSIFGVTCAGGVFVPINPLLKAEQVSYIQHDCNVKILITSGDRLNLLATVLPQCPELQTVIVVGTQEELPSIPGLNILKWNDLLDFAASFNRPHRIDSDMAAILYTSGSTGKPKGVVLSHRNLLAGAKSVASYLDNTANDRILAVLPLSFDYGLSQLTTAFSVGASVVLINHLFPRDIVKAVIDERITGLAAVPPLWIQLAQQQWPNEVTLRYITNSGGAMPKATLDRLRCVLPHTKVFLMYGLTEAFRSTYLPPSEIDRRPDSIGKAIPNAEIMVMRSDGTPCAPNEPGELVHRGALVSLGYWNDLEKTAERFKPVPQAISGLPLTEIAVWSGDTVRMDEESFLYFIGRQDEMIKVSGYRVSPSEVEEVVYGHKGVKEAVAFGVPHPTLGQAIVVIAVPHDSETLSSQLLSKECQSKLPAYMVPSKIEIQSENLPRNPNGKIDRKSLQTTMLALFDEASKT